VPSEGGDRSFTVVKLSGGEIVVRALEDEGIACAFGIPGTHNIELYDALAQSGQVRPVLVTDEQSASFMADGYWRASGRLACVNVVPGAKDVLHVGRWSKTNLLRFSWPDRLRFIGRAVKRKLLG